MSNINHFHIHLSAETDHYIASLFLSVLDTSPLSWKRSLYS